MLLSSGLYDRLVTDRLLIPHEEEAGPAGDPHVELILRPEQIRSLSYPYEWCFGQLKDAALQTLRIQKAALKHGMTLKDASAFNIQFRGCSPVFIDTLSFERNDGGPWVAYSQFCRHFLAPLLLMSRISPTFNQYLKVNLDGIPLDLASQLLPRSTYFHFGILVHIHLHARSQKKYAGGEASPSERAVPQSAADPKPGLTDSLLELVESLQLGRFETEWKHYYQTASHYTDVAEKAKRNQVSRILEIIRPSLVIDLGGNTGEYSRLATQQGIRAVCCDVDPMCVQQNYERSKAERDEFLLPLLMDLTNPTPDLGFALEERSSLLARADADLVLVLALIHHLRITGNIPLLRIAEFLASMGRRVLVEFVPKEDVMVQKMLRARPDTFFDYTEEQFRVAFAEYFEIEERVALEGSPRSLYLLKTRKAEGARSDG
ncbi:MAG TPA: hypothetical protein VFQ91_25380 [Bryobacteraceae bacterium]|nr:hypothetical protein [Bryobacteraceae bacterium]